MKQEVIKNRYLRLRQQRNMLRHLPDVIPEKTKNYLYRANFLAHGIVGHFLGVDWLVKNIVDYKGGENFIGKRSEYLKTPEVHKDQMRKVISFAEMLINLQDISGFEEVLKLAANNNLEDALAELESGKLLYSMGIWFRFNKTKGVIGSDYDLEFKVASGQLVAGDTKNKRLTTSLGVETIVNSFEKARVQVPRDRPAFVFLRVPTSWLEVPLFEIVENAVSTFFRNTSSVAVVIIHTTSNMEYYSEEFLSGGLDIRMIRNSTCKFQDEKGWMLLQNLNNPRWKSLFSMLGYKPPV